MDLKTLQEMSQVDVRTVDKSTLVQREAVKIDPNASYEERLQSFVEQINNPYCYLIGKAVVKISYTEGTRALDDCILHYLRGL